MSQPVRKVSTDEIGGLLSYIQEKGVKLWLQDGQLHYKAPKNALSQKDIETIRLAKGQIVSLLQERSSDSADGATLQHYRWRNRAPLTYSQMTHWRMYELNHRPSLRQIAAATRLRGSLNIGILEEKLAHMVLRHEALRTRVILADGTPVQEISDSSDFEFEFDNVSCYNHDIGEVTLERRIQSFIIKPINLASDSLFGVLLLRIRKDEHVLVLAMEHSISDAFSMCILLRELFTTYAQALRQQALSLPPISVQFPDYARWQEQAREAWIEHHGSYWKDRLAGCGRLRFPADGTSLLGEASAGWGTVSIHIGKSLKHELSEWCRVRKTTLVMAVFTAYVALVLRWCNAKDAVIQYQTDGRTDPKFENTIGYFASVLYLRVQLLDSNNFVDLLDRITREYCNAHYHADSSYMESQSPKPAFTHNSWFNWVSRGYRTDCLDTVGLSNLISCTPVDFDHPMLSNMRRDGEPIVLLFDGSEEIQGGVCFPLDRFSNGNIERFAANFMMVLEKLLRKPEEWVNDFVLL